MVSVKSEKGDSLAGGERNYQAAEAIGGTASVLDSVGGYCL
jgi:hypothetical protein